MRLRRNRMPVVLDAEPPNDTRPQAIREWVVRWLPSDRLHQPANRRRANARGAGR
jgi:hypothetical protein